MAQQVLSRNDLALDGSHLRVCPVKRERVQAECSDCTSDKSATLSHRRVVYVYNVPRNRGRDALELLFESKKYGGGEIEALDLDSEKGTAIVTYVHEEGTAKSVLFNCLFK